ncbi:YdiK family protein [Neobacillus niacini]|uniref:YdiK family protein n=1 Tax=Neobacillus niacini TaxID=86668 RepID=UPI002FFDDDA8
MRRSPFVSGIIYLVLGALFTYFAIEDVTQNGWGFFSYLLVLLATFDFGAGIRIFFLYNKSKHKNKK